MPEVVSVRFVGATPKRPAVVRPPARVADGNRVPVSDDVIDLGPVVRDRKIQLVGHRLPPSRVADAAAWSVRHEVISDEFAHRVVVGGVESIEQLPHRLHVLAAGHTLASMGHPSGVRHRGLGQRCLPPDYSE